MKQSNRLLWGVFLVALCLGLLLLGFNRLGWEGAFLFLAGVFLSLGLTRVLGTRDKKDENSTVEQVEKVPATSAVEDERDVFIPGRNFDEMLERLGSNESMLNVILNSMGEGVILLNQADRVV